VPDFTPSSFGYLIFLSISKGEEKKENDSALDPGGESSRNRNSN
jgi:hypothetical protein